MRPPPPDEAVGPLLRGVAVLRALAVAEGRAPLGELVRATGLARSTVDRLTGTLERMGYLARTGHSVALTPRLMELGNSYLAAVALPGPLGPVADRLADAIDEPVSLAVPDGDGVRLVHQSPRRRAAPVPFWSFRSFRVGDLLPAARTAQGAVFAAYGIQEAPTAADLATARVATDGYAIDDQGFEPGLVALALPVRAPGGQVVCAVAVISHTRRHSARSLRVSLLPRVRTAVAEMERRLVRADGPETVGGEGLAVWTRASKQEWGADFVESLARGLTVVTAFGEGRPALGLAAVARATGLPRATARRALITLEHLGLVAAHDGRFTPTPAVLGLGHAPLSRLTLAEIAAPRLSALAERAGDSASLAVLDGDSIVYTARAAVTRVMSVDIRTGTRFPAYATSMGRVLLAGLSGDERVTFLRRAERVSLTPRTLTALPELLAAVARAERDGHALVEEELERGLRSLAVPVRDRSGTVVAAVNVAMHTSRRSVGECLSRLLPALRATAVEIEGDLAVAGRFTSVPLT
ncbi:IclR family transcriptional regulator C-terminal domain-containing protein [Streptomyces sp. NPDC057638]|uniref:IclR family transcriptional regulator domain-containing protein n=1 Tax=Streptomyces sp. NPDC057638 TaxID=3346190 RepID=UPI0036AFEA88